MSIRTGGNSRNDHLSIYSQHPITMENVTVHEDSTLLLRDVALPASTPTVDTSTYSLSSEEAAFFKAQIGIDDDEDLKRHILEVQAKAYKASHP